MYVDNRDGTLHQLREHAIKDILSSTGITMLSSTNGFTPLCTCDLTMSHKASLAAPFHLQRPKFPTHAA